MHYFKKILIAFLTLFVFLVLMLSIITFFYGDKICNTIIKLLNKNINTEITYKSTNLSLFKFFPNAAISFHNINISSVNNFSFINIDTINSKKLLFANEASVKFNILYLLLDKTLIINGIEVNNGIIQLMKNQKEESNSIFFNKNENNTSTFQIHKILLHNTQLKIVNEKENFYLYSFFKDVKLSGNIQSNNLDIFTKASINQIFISFKKGLNNFQWNNSLTIKLYLKNNNNELFINKGNINTLNEEILFSGKLHNTSPYNYSINSRIKNFKFPNLSKFPFKQIKSLKIDDGTGNIRINISGNIDGNNYPNISAFADINKLYFNYKKYKINNLRSNINIECLNKHKYVFKVKSSGTEGYLFNNKFNISELIYNSYNDSITILGNISVNLGNIEDIIKNDVINFRSGILKLKININSIIKNNDYKNILINSLKNLECSFENTNCTFNSGYSLENINSDIYTTGDTLKISNFKGKINGSNISFTGFLPQIFIYTNDSINHNIKIEGSLDVQYINFNKLLFIKSDSINNSKYEPYSIELNSKLYIDSSNYNNINIIKYSSNVFYKNKKLIINNLNAKFCNGNIFNSSFYYNTAIDTPIITFNCNYKKIDIESLLISFNNFKQNELTAKNIKGVFNGNINFTFQFYKEKLLKPSLKGEVDFEIINGRLIDFKPVYKLSKFIELNELNDIKFKKISNKILIENSIIIIPPMVINSSVLNLTLSGTQSLENEYEYHFTVLLSEILYKKSKITEKAKTEFYQLEEDTLKHTNAYFKLNGNSNTYKISYDTKQALKSFTDKIKSEKNRLKKIFYEEFGLFKNESTNKNIIFNNNSDSNKNTYTRRLLKINPNNPIRPIIYFQDSVEITNERSNGSKTKDISNTKFKIESDDINNKQEIKPVKKKQQQKIEWKDE